MGASLGGGDDDEGIVGINITPFVDIILVVLIIFMVTTSYIGKKSIKFELPEAATGEAVSADQTLAIQLDAAGALSVEDEPSSLDGLRSRVRNAKAEATPAGGSVICLIGADKATAHGKVVEVIDLVRQEGVAKFAINIDPVAPPPAAAPVGDGAAPAAP